MHVTVNISPPHNYVYMEIEDVVDQGSLPNLAYRKLHRHPRDRCIYNNSAKGGKQCRYKSKTTLAAYSILLSITNK